MSDAPDSALGSVQVPPYEPTEAERYAAQPQLDADTLAALDEHEDDPPEFDRAKVPDNEYSEYFFDQRTGRGLTDEEYNETIRRIETFAEQGDVGAIALLVGIRGRA